QTVLFSALVASTAFNTYAVEAPNEALTLSEFVRLASTKMKTNIVISPELEEQKAHVYGADKYAIENLFNAVLAANGLQVRRVDGVHVLELKNHISAKYEMRVFNL
ncbi:hypothetical protein, partial [Vibrio parahaemolyticus]|uniref:hypothetical protein n=1 Tax=Vibrio parahaemolyticus TaxID=670 RepID=UPI001172CD0B